MKKPKIELLGDRVMVQKIVEDKRDSGIIVPGNPDSGGFLKAKVIKVGEGRILDNGDILEPRVKEGDTIWFSAGYGAEEFKEESNNEYLIIRESNIVGIAK